MSFMVVLRQHPVGMNTMLTTVEMSMDTLQLKLIKDMDNIISVNDVRLTRPQKEALHTIGTRWDVTDVRPGNMGTALVTARREGYLRVWLVALDGSAHFVDGMDERVQTTRQDPLNSSPWGSDLTDMVQ